MKLVETFQTGEGPVNSNVAGLGSSENGVEVEYWGYLLVAWPEKHVAMSEILVAQSYNVDGINLDSRGNQDVNENHETKKKSKTMPSWIRFSTLLG